MKRLFLVFLLVVSAIRMHASTGCVINSTVRLFPNYTGVTKLGYRIYEKTGEINGLTMFCYYNTGVNCAMRTLVAAECSGCYKEAGDPYYYALGTEWVYYSSPAMCPLDDYAFPLLICIGCIAFYRFRKASGFPLTY